MKGKKILLCGAGGGYDIFTGLPLFFELKKRNKISLLSFSFTEEKILKEFSEKVEDTFNCFLVDYSTFEKKKLPKFFYFPELKLSEQLETVVYAINTHTNLDQYEKGMKKIVENNKIDVIIAVDGGCDSVLTGKEKDLATPVEDMMTMFAVSKMNIKESYLTCLGSNVELIDKKDFEACVQKLKEQHGIIGGKPINLKKMLEEGSESVKKYVEVFKMCDTNQSVINSSIIAALEGKEGKYENPLLKNRISLKENFPFIDETTTYLWVFDLKKVILNNIYIMDALEVLKKPIEIDAFTYILGDHFFPSKKYKISDLYPKKILKIVTPILEKVLKKIEN